LLDENKGAPLAEIQSRLLGAVHAWTGSDFEDDLTLVLVRAL